MEQFTSLEKSLIKTSLGTKLDGELAELLERPIEQVNAFMDELTGTTFQQRYDIICLRRNAEEAKLIKPLSDKKKRAITEKEYKLKRERKVAVIQHQEERRKKELNNRASMRRFPTMERDYSKMKTVRIDSKTIIWVLKSVSDADAIKKYHENIQHYKDDRKHIPHNKKIQ